MSAPNYHLEHTQTGSSNYERFGAEGWQGSLIQTYVWIVFSVKFWFLSNWDGYFDL